MEDDLFLEMPQDFKWRDPWVAIRDPRAQSVYGQIVADQSNEDVGQGLVDELIDEMCSEHPLFSAKLRAVAFCQADFNEVLFLTNLTPSPIVCVHLTWQQENDRRWPHFGAYQSWDAWKQQMDREAGIA